MAGMVDLLSSRGHVNVMDYGYSFTKTLIDKITREAKRGR